MHHSKSSRIVYLWQCCTCGHAGINVATTQSCVNCIFHHRCGNCRTEVHKIDDSEPKCSPCQPIEVPPPKVSAVKDTADPVNSSECFEGAPMLETSAIPLPHQSNSYTISAVVASGQLQHRQLEEIFVTGPDLGSSLSNSTDKSAMLLRYPENLTSNDEQTPSDGRTSSSAGHLTSSSDDLEEWEETLSLNGCEIDNEVLLEIFRGPLDTLFQEWLGQVRSHGNGKDKGRPPSSASPLRSNDHQRPQSKRKRDDREENEGSDNEPDKSRGAQKRLRKQTPLHKLLACPYYKKDTRQHHACCGFGFKKISYVKSHIYKKHAIAIYCPVCQQTFNNVHLRDSHTRERTCERVDNTRAPDGITSEQRGWLGRRGPRGLTEKQQWFRIFEHLFPGHPVPESAYNEVTVSKDMLSFKNFVTSPRGLEAFLDRVRENHSWTPEMEAEFLVDIEEGLAQVYARWAETNHSEAGQTQVNESPSREPETSGQSTVVATSSTGIQSGTRSDRNSASPAPEATEQEAFDGTTPTTAVVPPEDTEPQLGSALAFADFELEERKVDEADQMLPRQLNDEGITPVPPQGPWDLEGPLGSEDVEYDAVNLSVPNEIQYDDFDLDALLNLPYEMAGAELWTAPVDVSEALLTADGILEDFGVNTMEDAPAAPDDGKEK